MFGSRITFRDVKDLEAVVRYGLMDFVTSSMNGFKDDGTGYAEVSVEFQSSRDDGMDGSVFVSFFNKDNEHQWTVEREFCESDDDGVEEGYVFGLPAMAKSEDWLVPKPVSDDELPF